jgi:DNA-binding IclR family transcriptional regulator
LVHVTMRHGTVMSLRNTASGRLFAAYLPEATVIAALQEEHAYALRHTDHAAATPPTLDDSFSNLLKTVRENGLSDAVNLLVPGVSALAAPVFDESGQLVLSLTAIGPTAQLDVSLNGSIASTLKSLGRDLSQRLGYRF